MKNKKIHKPEPDLQTARGGQTLIDFCQKHAYLVLAFLTLCCLFIGQYHQAIEPSGRPYNDGINGERLSLPLVGAVLLALILAAAGWVLFRSKHEKKLLWGFGALALSVAAVEAFGVGKLSFFASAVLFGGCVWLISKKLSPVKRIGAALVIPASSVAGYFALIAADTVADGMVYCIAFLLIGVALVCQMRGTLNSQTVVLLVILMGFALRLNYVLTIHLPQNQHDVFGIAYNAKYPRHNSYIWHIYENWALPEEKVYNAGLSQYYHPPLHHFISALWMRFQNLLGLDEFRAYENIQYLTTFYSAAMMVAADKLFEHFNFKGALRVALVALIAFHPAFFMLAGSVNNDCLCILLSFVAVLYTVRWYKEPSYKNSLCLALAIGGSMLVKLSGAVVAIATAYVMLAKLFDLRTGVVNNVKSLWKKFALFAAVCFPLGLWWPIRCRLIYGMPLGYVPAMSANSDQYLEGYSLWERLSGSGSFSLQNPYPNIGLTDMTGGEGKYYDYGIAPYAFKSSFFGEYFTKLSVSNTQNVLAYVMSIAALIMIAFSIVGIAVGIYYSYCNDRNHNMRKNPILIVGEEQSFRFLVLYHGALIGSYALFCIRYPFTCTMDFRYIIPALLLGAVEAGVMLRGEERWKKPLKCIYYVATVLFCMATVGFYLMFNGR